jgi:methylaspartate mutase sigma subunit
MTPISEFVEAAVETAADAVVFSSSNGHAAIFCDGVRDAFIEAGLPEIGLYIGGNLRVGSRTAYEDVEEEFERMGFNRVFPPNADLGSAMELLADDLDTRSPREA